MDQLAIARRALEEEVSALSAEIARIEKVLEALGATDSIAPYAKRPAAASVSTREPVKAAASVSSSSNAGSALEIIQSAGRKGIKALALASIIKKSGGTRPTKEELLATGKVKMSGRGGGTTYTYAG